MTPDKTKKGWTGDNRLDANKITDLPDTLDIIQRGNDPHHYEIVPKKPMKPDAYKEELNKIKCG